MRIGRLQSIHRYPVKSMAGETIEQSDVADDGVTGDRAFAIRDEAASEIRGGRQLPKLLMCSARYVEEPRAGGPLRASVVMPDGSALTTDDPALAPRVSALLGREVTIWPRRPASDKQHYRRKQPGAGLAGTLTRASFMRKLVSKAAGVGPGGRTLREEFGRLDGEPLPDLSVMPPELWEYVSPLGTYFDLFPIHIITTATLDALRAKNPDGDWNVARFRPNFVVETDASLTGLIEAGWEGRVVRVGPVRIECTVATFRCSMVGQPQQTHDKDTTLLRTIVREANQCVGMYARVLQGGHVACGDEVVLEDR